MTLAPADTPKRRYGWAVAAFALLIVIAAIGAVATLRQDARVIRFEIPAPQGSVIEWNQPLSPDGRTLAFIAGTQGKTQIWVRPLDAGAARPLSGTEGATRSFWSPDSQRVAFFVDGNLREVGIDGRAPRLIVQGPFRDGAWHKDGVILVGGQLSRPLFRVSERGGQPVAETVLEEKLGETSHDYPEFLPDGRHYIYLARRGTDELITYVGTLGSRERRELPGVNTAVKYSPTGHLLFLRGTALMAQRFSAERLELSGDPFPVAENAAGSQVASFSISEDGTLAFIGGFAPEALLTWFDRSGQQLGSAGPPDAYGDFDLSSDDRMVAFDRRAAPFDIFLLEIERGSRKVTSDPADEMAPIWSPDGRMVAFTSARSRIYAIYQRAVGAAGEDQRLMSIDVPVTPSDWSRDGSYLAYSASGDVWAMPLSGRTPIRITTSSAEDVSATFSPDIRWVAYQSAEGRGITRSGEGDIFIQSFPQPDVKQQISTAGGFAPRWSDDGRELFYVAPDGMLMGVAINAQGATLDVGTPKPLFAARPAELSAGRPRYAVSKDGRFLVRVAASDLTINVIINWSEQLRRGETQTR